MRRRAGLFLVAALVCGCSAPSAGAPVPVTAPGSSTSTAVPGRAPGEVVLTFAGDVHFAERTTALLNDPASAFGPISEVLAASDLAMVNLETAVTTRGTAEQKQYLFRAPPSAYRAVRAAGVDVVSLGNNHTLDYGRVGLADGIEHAKQAGMPIVGAGADIDAAFAPWITEVNQTKIAFLGISQVHELEKSWSASDSRAGVAHAREPEAAVAAVRAAAEQSDFVVVYMHWGKENKECPTEEMQTFGRKLATAGADLIVGTHAHLFLGDGWLGGTFVAYGLGNFLWWWNDAHSNDTGVLRITLRDKKITNTELVPAYISRDTGQPLPVTGAEGDRITAKYTALRECTGLASAPF